MKIAYCILCHRNNNILKELLYQLKGEDIYIHIDKKSDIMDFPISQENVVILKNRFDVKWGHFNTVEAIIELIKTAMNKSYDYVFLLSGDCLPLKNKQAINSFINEHIGKEFIGVMRQSDEEQNRIKYIYKPYTFKKNKTIIEKGIFKIQTSLKLFKKNPLYYKLPPLYKGCMWFTFTGSFCNYILEYIRDNQWYVDAFRDSYCGDEVFFNTIICNSPYKDNIYKLYDKIDDNHMALRYIDWSGPELPKMLDEEDFINMKDEKLLFGRKFSDKLDIKKYRSFVDENSK